MVSLDDYKGGTPAWCPGCGNFSILKAFKEAMVELEIEPHQACRCLRNRTGRQISPLYTVQHL